MNTFIQTKGDLSSKGNYYTILAYNHYCYKGTANGIGNYIDAFFEEEAINQITTDFTKLTTTQKRKLLKEVSTCSNYYFTYLYFDKRSITDPTLFKDKKQLKNELFKCFLLHYYNICKSNDFEGNIHCYKGEDEATIKEVINELNKKGQKRLEFHDDYEPIYSEYLDLVNHIIHKHQQKGETSLYNLVPIINPVVINQASFTKNGKIKPKVMNER